MQPVADPPALLPPALGALGPDLAGGLDRHLGDQVRSLGIGVRVRGHFRFDQDLVSVPADDADAAIRPGVDFDEGTIGRQDEFAHLAVVATIIPPAIVMAPVVG